jgi:hypothetical protein
LVPVDVDTTILSDQPAGWYGVRFGCPKTIFGNSRAADIARTAGYKRKSFVDMTCFRADVVRAVLGPGHSKAAELPWAEEQPAWVRQRLLAPPIVFQRQAADLLSSGRREHELDSEPPAMLKDDSKQSHLL